MVACGLATYGTFPLTSRACYLVLIYLVLHERTTDHPYTIGSEEGGREGGPISGSKVD